MSARMKKHPTKETASISWGGVSYLVPLSVLKDYQVTEGAESTLSIEEVFSDLTEKYTEPGLLLKGLRAKEDLTQVQFAKKIKVTQANLSAMENGKRPIGKEIAKRIARQFDFDYRWFL